jgi:hypothetical protein
MDYKFFACLICAVTGFSIGMTLGITIREQQFKKQLLENKLAYYDEDTGEFTLKDLSK